MILSNVDNLIHITEDAIKQFFRGAIDIVNPLDAIKYPYLKHLIDKHATVADVKSALEGELPYKNGTGFARNLGRGTTVGLGLSAADHYYNKVKDASPKEQKAPEVKQTKEQNTPEVKQAKEQNTPEVKQAKEQNTPEVKQAKEVIPQKVPEVKRVEDQMMDIPDIKSKANPLSVAGTGLALGTGAYLLHKKFKNENAKNFNPSN